MKTQLFIALRYLFSKKSHNIINIISMICAGGVCVATVALVCTLSVYNGFQTLITGIVSTFDPDLKITLCEGKTFAPSEVMPKIAGLPCVSVASEVLEEDALVRGNGKQSFVTVKGISSDYTSMVDTRSIMEAGRFETEDGEAVYTILGAALASQIDAAKGFAPVAFYAPKYATKVNVAKPDNSFNTQYVYVGGIYATHQLEIDSKYAFLPLRYARELFNYGEVVSSVELKVEGDVEAAKAEVAAIVGDKFKVQNKEEQHADFYKMMKVEKWITFLILFFILVVAAVNIIGSLTMLILEKGEDIKTLFNLGATTGFIRRVFLLEGWLISVIGAVSGTAIGLVLCLLQQHFGLIKLGGDEAADTLLLKAYPVCVEWADIALILGSVLLVGLVIAWIPTRYINRRK